jgi:hypothetical protein
MDMTYRDVAGAKQVMENERKTYQKLLKAVGGVK